MVLFFFMEKPMNNPNQKPKKVKVKILKNCRPENTQGLEQFLDGLGRLPKDAIVEMADADARKLVKIKAASMDAAV